MTGQDPLSQAIAFENGLRDEAGKLWDEWGNPDLDAEKLRRLMPFLRGKIPAGFITTTPAVKGKPYESTGIRSVQVCIDRMDNVLLPHNWTFTDHYEQDGKLCRVTVVIWGEPIGENRDVRRPLVSRVSYGGVDRATGTGNLLKGSFTNAAKRAFAMVGVGHEVYLGATDYDPDVDPEAAAEQGRTTRKRPSAKKASKSRAQPPEEPDPSSGDPEEQLAQLLAIDDSLANLRSTAEEGMKILGAKPSQRVRELAAASDEESLRQLITRIDNSLEEINSGE